MLRRFYHPPPHNKLFGTLLDIYGLVAGISQCICCIVQYVYCLQHADNPFKASLLPAIFLLCLGGSKLSNNRTSIPLITTSSESLWIVIPLPLPLQLLAFQVQARYFRLNGVFFDPGGEPLGCAGLPLYTLALFMLFTFWVGHERATPESVLEVLDVKDLTLALVRSHLQIYRTVFIANRAAAFSG